MENALNKQRIVATFEQDIREFIIMQVDLPSLYRKSQNFIQTAPFESLLTTFIYYRERYPLGKRRVFFSREFKNSLKYIRYQKAIEKIVQTFEKGKDIKCYLHQDIKDFLFHDNLLRDWGILHLHLFPDGQRKNHDNDILYVFLAGKDVLFIDIFEHDFVRPELLEILKNNCIPRHYAPNVEGIPFNREMILSLRNKNIGYGVNIDGGCFFGGMKQVSYILGAQQIIILLDRIAQAITEEKKQLEEKISVPMAFDSLDFHLNINVSLNSIMLYERQSQSEIRFSNSNLLQELWNCFSNLNLF